MKTIPYLLILIRLLCAPVIILLATEGDRFRIAIVALITVGFLSDIFDGIIARRVGAASPLLRRFDSQTDVVFWLAVGVACWMLSDAFIRTFVVPLSCVIFLEVMSYVVSFYKFSREGSSHAYLSKLFGALLFAGTVALIGWNNGNILPYTFAFGILSQLDSILITLILPEWKYDVPSSYHALIIRRTINHSKT